MVLISGTSLKSKRFETNQVYLQQRRFVSGVLWSSCYKVSLYDIQNSNRNGWFHLFTKVFKYSPAFELNLMIITSRLLKSIFLINVNLDVGWVINSYPGFYTGWYRPNQEDYGLYEDVLINCRKMPFNLKDKWTHWWL